MSEQERQRPSVPFEVRLYQLLADAAELMRYMDIERVERVKPGLLGAWYERYRKLQREASERGGDE